MSLVIFFASVFIYAIYKSLIFFVVCVVVVLLVCLFPFSFWHEPAQLKHILNLHRCTTSNDSFMIATHPQFIWLLPFEWFVCVSLRSRDYCIVLNILKDDKCLEKLLQFFFTQLDGGRIISWADLSPFSRFDVEAFAVAA